MTTPDLAIDLPEDIMILVPTRNLVLFPGLVLPITVGRPRSVAAVQAATQLSRPVGVVLQHDESVDEPKMADLHSTGTLAAILRFVTSKEGSHHVVCQGEQRFRIVEPVEGHDFMAAKVEMIDETHEVSPEIEARAHHLRGQATEILSMLPDVPADLIQAVEAITAPAMLADVITSYLDLTPPEKQQILEQLDLTQRLDLVAGHLSHRLEVLKISKRITESARETMTERQRQHFLREQLHAIQRELGEEEGKKSEIEDLNQAIAKARMPLDVEEHTKREMQRLERMPEAAAEYSMTRLYLDWMVELPWGVEKESPIDINEARRILDEDHYGLEKVKRRILEFLAVRKLAPEGKSPILCLVGPPGVGKTSLGHSIARATERSFARVALGGVHDEAEIRGHRRTYIGAMPGTIIQAIKKAGSRTCVLMLDEMDKLGQGGFQGDPSSALLEVLDPEQNSRFRDNYIGVPFDLSRVMFIATANRLDTIPGPLLDRMEVITLPGYTEQEKFHIAKRYLIPRQIAANGLKPDQITLTDDALHSLIHDYTREAGVRNLERKLGAVLRHMAVRVAEGQTGPFTISLETVPEVLGGAPFEAETAMRTSVPGVATGLAWTPTGGDILFIEASRMPGSGKLILTGQLGDVMKESAQAALSLMKSRAVQLGIDPQVIDRTDIHVHVPAGAIPKDGPSAGVAMFTALVSAFTDRNVRSDTAMTGEISLRGLVLPVGGIKEKVVAAVRAGIEHVMLPKRNAKDLDEIPEDARKRVTFTWVENVDQAIAGGLNGSPHEQAQQ